MNTPFKSVEWTESMAVGIEAVDKQHRFLIDTLREANEKLLTDPNDVMLQQVTMEMLRYAIMHFETEEKVMQRYGYQDAYPEEAQKHIAQHRDFSSKIVAIRDQLREGQEVSRMDVLTFLNNWLHDHLLDIDQKFGDFVHKAKSESEEESGK